MIDSRTTARNLPRPDPANTIAEDFPRVRAAMDAIDADLAAILTGLAGKASVAHPHPISDVTGLQSALDGKSATIHNHALASLQGVNLTGAANGQVLGIVAGLVQAVTLIAEQIPGLDASKIISGTLDPARVPVLTTADPVISSGDLGALTTQQQAAIVKGSWVVTTDGKRWLYGGTGSKTSSGSYIEIADTTPEWSAVANKPATFPPSAHDISLVTGLQAALDAKSNSLQPLTTIASAATTAIGGVGSEGVEITGTTNITSFGTAPAGTIREGRFTGALTLTHNATSLILPGAANIVTAANDRFRAVSLGAGNWLVVAYQRANGQAVVAPPAGAATPTASAGPGQWMVLSANRVNFGGALPMNLPAGGTWAWLGMSNNGSPMNTAGVSAGGSTIFTIPADTSGGDGGMYAALMCWRVA